METVYAIIAILSALIPLITLWVAIARTNSARNRTARNAWKGF